ncbi:MAG TPA: sugar ABC transporter permease [Spirochaetia bacterium]|nr:sugar ABC transporter permease [Spirochaetia bacterium]
MRKRNKHWKGIILFILPVLIIYGAFFLYPLGFVGIVSLVKWNGVTPMRFVGLQNYISNFANPVFQTAFRNNFIWAFSLGFIQVAFAALVALILARRPPAWKMLRTIFFLPNVISKVAIAMMWLALYNADYGLINTLLGKLGLAGLEQNWLGQTTTALPAVIFQEAVYIGYFMIIVLAGAMSIPESFYEAAEMDGASVFQQERFITIPMVRGILVTSMTLAVAFGLRHFESTFLMTRGGPANSTQTMGLLLYENLGSLDYGHANAIGAVLIIVGAVIIVIIRRVFGDREAGAEARQ